jgi:hypothetical protein
MGKSGKTTTGGNATGGGGGAFITQKGEKM